MTETDILAIVAIVMSAASLGWQAVSWLRSGAVIQAALDFINDTATVTVYNSGRTAATITSVSVWGSSEISSLIRVKNSPLPESDPIPSHLPAGGHAKWHFATDGVRSIWELKRKDSPYPKTQGKLHAYVWVGINKSVHAHIDVCAKTTDDGLRNPRRSH